MSFKLPNTSKNKLRSTSLQICLSYGEKVNMWSHVVQAAHFAREDGRSTEIILAAFLHDVGHMPKVSGAAKQMTSEILGYVGSDNHGSHG